jgi:MFS family permease
MASSRLNPNLSPASHSPLTSRNFILLVAGQGLSLFANTMLRFAMSMWVLDETGSASAFASMLAVAVVPTILLSPFGGVLADRINRRTIMVALDALSGTFIVLAAVWFAAGNGFSMVAVSALMVSLSVLSAFETPTVQAALPQLLRDSGETAMRRGMAIVNQVQQLTSLLPSFAGGVLYAAFGIRMMLIISITGFYATAVLECFLRLAPPRRADRDGAATATDEDTSKDIPTAMPTPIEDIKEALRFLIRKQPNILKLMLFATVVNFFVNGNSSVGFTYMVRATLGFNATIYGISEGIVGIAGVAGAFITGALASKLIIERFPVACYAIAVCVLPCAAAFAAPFNGWTRLALIVASFCGMIIAASFTTIIAIPAIQMRTPEALTGKVMAMVSSLSICAMPLGQMAYGWAYDHVPPLWIALVTAAAIAALTLCARSLFAHFDAETEPHHTARGNSHHQSPDVP